MVKHLPIAISVSVRVRVRVRVRIKVTLVVEHSHLACTFTRKVFRKTLKAGLTLTLTLALIGDFQRGAYSYFASVVF